MEILKNQLIITTIVLAIVAVALLGLLILYIRQCKKYRLVRLLLRLLLRPDEEADEKPFEECESEDSK